MSALPEGLYTAALLRQMHPDIWESTPETDIVLSMWEKQDRIKAQHMFWLSCITDGIIEYNRHTSYATSSEVITQYDSLNQVDSEATIKKFAQIIKWARNKGYTVTKDYSDYYFTVVVKVNNNEEYSFQANRESVCERIKIGITIIPATEEKIVDRFDWNCEKLSFMEVEV